MVAPKMDVAELGAQALAARLLITLLLLGACGRYGKTPCQ